MLLVSVSTTKKYIQIVELSLKISQRKLWSLMLNSVVVVTWLWCEMKFKCHFLVFHWPVNHCPMFKVTLFLGHTFLSFKMLRVFTVLQLRKRMRFILGNLHDFIPEESLVQYEDLLPQDKYYLHILSQYAQKVSQSTLSLFNFGYSMVVQSVNQFP